MTDADLILMTHQPTKGTDTMKNLYKIEFDIKVDGKWLGGGALAVEGGHGPVGIGGDPSRP